MDATAQPPSPLDTIRSYWRANVRWRASTLALGGVVLLGLSFRLGALRLPFDRDEGAYGTIGRGLWHGVVPYRDVFDHKPPVIYGFYALASLAGDELLAVRAMSAALFAACIVLVFLIGRRVYGERAGVMAALAFALIGNDFTVEAARANTEQVMLPTLLASVYCYVRSADGTGRRWLLLCGMLGGLAVLTKPVAGVPLAALALHAVAAPPGARPREAAIVNASVIIVGAALPVCVAGAYFAANGALDEFYASVVTFNSEYVRHFWDNGYRGQVTDLSPLASPYAMLAFASVFAGALLPPEHRRLHILIIAWTAANIVGAKMGVRTFGHYFVPVLPGIALLSAAFVEAMIVSARRAVEVPGWQRYAPAIAAVAIAGGWQARENVGFYFMDTQDTQVRREFGQQGPMAFARAEEVARYVQTETAAGEPILVWAAEPEVYFLSDRPPVSRFVYGLTLDFAHESLVSMRDDFLSRAPRTVVISTHGGVADMELLSQRGYERTFAAGWLEVYQRSGESHVAGSATEP